MRNLPNPAHPPWCLRGSDCAGRGDLHLSRLVTAATGNEVIQLRMGLWRMEIGDCPPSGLLLELSAGAEAERWPIGLEQSRAMVHLSRRLVRDLTLTARRAA
ncbi:hypothetical protein [Micromonospora fluostatini]|uniref:hypothetical protein n=1 Tax=Micromonospora sp. JCM 30529 TaxID=3421643 RepID=UPI003D176E76